MIEIASEISPWLSALFGIGTAVAAEQAFRYGSKGSTPDRWRGSEVYADFDLDEESDERMARDCARESSAAWQAGATYLAAGAAVEAAAASQQGAVAIILAAIGVCSIVPILLRFGKAREQSAWLQAWYLRGKWDVDRKLIRSHNFAEEDATFAKEHPREAATLKKRRE